MNASAVVRLAALAAVATACAPRPGAPPRPDENTIRAALNTELRKFGPALAAKDAAAAAKLFTDDGTWILPDASTFTGRVSIESGARKLFDSFESAAMDRITIDKLVAINDSEAVTFSHSEYTLTAKGKAPVKHLNPFADHWKKGADGVWRVTYEINADGPAPTAVQRKP